MSGGVTGAILATRQIFADSATFRTLVGAANQAAALAKIYEGRVDDATQAPPRLIVLPLRLGFQATGGYGHFQVSGGQLQVCLEHAPSSPASYADASFNATVDAINSEVLALMNGSGLLNVDDVDLFILGQIPKEENNGNEWWRADWLLTLGGLP